MNALFHAGMRLGPTGKRWVAILGWLFVGLPCLGMAAVTAFLAFWEGSDHVKEAPGAGWVPVSATVVSYGETVRRDGDATRTDSELVYRYDVGGTEFDGRATGYAYHYQNEGARRAEADRTAWLPEEKGDVRRKPGDRLTAYYDPGAPWKSTLRMPDAGLVLGNLALWSFATGSAGILLTVLGAMYLRDPVEIRVATPSHADVVVAAALGMVVGPPGAEADESAISADVAEIRRFEGTTEIRFRSEAGPAFHVAGLFPPVLLLSLLVWYLALGQPDPLSARGLVAHAALAGVVAFIVAALVYARAQRMLRIRNGVLESVTSGLFGRRTRRATRAQVDRIEPRWALSEVSRFGEAAYFDVVAVRGDGRQVTVAEGLPRVEVADGLARLLGREMGLAPEQVVSYAQARARDLGIARGALAATPTSRRGPA